MSVTTVFKIQWLKDLSIRYKLFLVSALAAGGFIVFVGLNHIVAHDNSVRLDHVGELYFPVLNIADGNMRALDKITESFSDAVIAEEMDFIDEADELAVLTKNNFEAVKRIDPAMGKDVEILSGLFANYYKIARKVTSGMLKGTIEAKDVRTGVASMTAALNKYSARLNEFRNNRYDAFNEELKMAKLASQRLVFVGLAVGGVIVVLISISLFIVSMLISENLNKIISSLKELARGEGDLTKRLKTNTRDETGQVVFGFNAFLDKLQMLILDVVMSTEQLGANAGQLSMVAETTAGSVNKQKHETEQLMTAMTEMAKTVSEVAKNSGEVAVAASAADSETLAGQEILNETVTVIDSLETQIQTASSVISDLQDRSDAIGSVLDVIRGIAEQTNLLALNAAIEAARAGENGRGFAVVADEVRTLASRTQSSTVEIQNMIESLQKGSASAVAAMDESSQQARESVESINRAGKSLDSIASSVSAIHNMSMEISTATEEQSAVADEMNGNIVNINKLAENTSMSAQITTSASSELNDLANGLIKLVGAFKVKEKDEDPDIW